MRRVIREISNRVQRFRSEEHGIGSVLMIATLPLFLLLGGLAIDAAGAYSTQTALQATADSAAHAAAMDLPDTSAARSTAVSYAARNLPAEKNGAVLTGSDVQTGNWSIITGTFTRGGAPLNAVRVLVRRSTVNGNPFPTSFLALAKRSGWDVSALAIASFPQKNSDCLLALGTTGPASVVSLNQSTLNLTNCGMAVNGTLANALALTFSSLTASKVTLAGLAAAYASVNSTASPTPIYAPAVKDPYAADTIPSVGPCQHTNFSVSAAPAGTRLDPGVYCNGLGILNHSVVTLDSGTYIINGGTLAIDQSSVSGTGVSFILTGSGLASTATVAVSNSSVLDIAAPLSGPLAGVAMFGDRNGAGIETFSSNLTLRIAGALYFPTATVSFSNGAATGPCTQLIAWNIVFLNSSYTFDSNCAGTAVQGIGVPPVLVE